MALACAVVLSPECCLHLLKHPVFIHACYGHLIWQIEVVLEHVVSVMVPDRRRIGDGRHLLRCEKRRVLAGFAPALVFHLVSCGHYKTDPLCRKLFHHSGPTGLICAVRRIPSTVISLSAFLDLRITGKSE